MHLKIDAFTFTWTWKILCLLAAAIIHAVLCVNGRKGIGPYAKEERKKGD